MDNKPASPIEDASVVMTEFLGPVGETRQGLVALIGNGQTISAIAEWGATAVLYVLPAARDIEPGEPAVEKDIAEGPGAMLVLSSLKGVAALRACLDAAEKHLQRCVLNIYEVERDGGQTYLAAPHIQAAHELFGGNPAETPTTTSFAQISQRRAAEIKVGGAMSVWELYLALGGKPGKIVRISRDKAPEFYERS